MTHTNNPFHRFIQLVNLDRQIFQLNEKISALEHEMRSTQNQEKQQMQLLEKAKESVHDAKKRVNALELEIKELDALELKKKGQFERVSGQKEYFAVQAELEQINTKRFELEDALVEAWATVESMQREFEKKSVVVQEQLNAVHAVIAQYEQKKAALNEELNNAVTQRAEKEEGISEEWLSTYQHMRASVVDPVVTADDGSCSVCYYPVTESDLGGMRRNKLIQCKSCFRLLYLATALK